MADACNHFLSWKLEQLDAGEITGVYFANLQKTCSYLVEQLGKTLPVEAIAPADFQQLRRYLSNRFGPSRLAVEVAQVRMVFRYCYEAELIDATPRYGPGFKPPSAKTQRKHRASVGRRYFNADELRQILEAADPAMRVAVLLAVNGGLTPTDLALMPAEVVDLKNGWLDWARTKNGIPRRIPLWPETVEAIRNAPKPETDHALADRRGRPWAEGERNAHRRLGWAFTKLTGDLGIHRPGVGFRRLRNTFEQVASGCKDQVAVDAVMGHTPRETDIGARYRDSISDERLRDCVNVVRTWLFQEGGAA